VAKGFGWPGWKLGFEGVNARVGRWLLEELVPDLKTHSPIKSADVPDSVENGQGELKQGKGANERQKEREKGLMWFRPKNSRMDSKSELLASEESGKPEAQAADLLSDSNRLRGWALMDYFVEERGLVPLLVEFNYQGRKSGEEGWP
jgi:1-phosphatidylinositol phosphodiesterase